MTQTQTIALDKQFDETMVTITVGGVSTGFVPVSTTVKKGSTVVWTNRDINDHTVVGGSIDSGTLRPGQTYSKTFTSTGSFDYHCGIHTGMNGTINVVN